jgi:hypothetical protein
MNITEHLAEIQRLSQIINSANKELESHKAVVKEYADHKSVTSLAAPDGRLYTKKFYSKPVFNEEKAVALATSKGLDPQSLTKAVIDETKFQALVKLGVIAEEEYMACYDDVGHARWIFVNQQEGDQ